ncbi:MAG: DNA mismatch repair endonuclease MutL [Desulfobacca sp.]|uniref:DNA mismatch repair endonuclease MutL n=1 Tax=Desulfobacca sp. TaxID=2067990 RepID=UPI00404916CE
MQRISILPPEIASRIAAGEVITRPASVVKELVENSLDAGARTISVEVVDGGCHRLRVTDDGCGMWPEEAPLSLLRHATSKLRQDDDLLCLTTLGFRGEALPSIAAVARLELCSRRVDREVGCRLLVEGGVLRDQTPWAGPAGTQVTVSDLFYNTPARRKFLRSQGAEQAHILELLRHLALCYPEVHFLVQAQGKTVLQAPVHRDARERLAAILGVAWAEAMLELDLAMPGLQVRGLASPPDQHLASPRYQFLSVNRRLVSDRLLTGALRQAYQGLLPKGRHPVVLLEVAIAPDQVDVNVHPTKAEVRFKDSGRVFGAVLSALRQALEPTQRPGRQEFTGTWKATPALPVQEARPTALFSNLPPLPAGIALPPQPPEAMPQPPVGPQEAQPAWRFADLPILGQLQATYILAQAPEGLLIIDQHAAHERILFEKLSRSTGQPAPRQTLLFPVTVEVAPAAAAWVEAHLNTLQEVGLELEPFGGSTFLVRALPACLAQQEGATVVSGLIAELAPAKDGEEAELRRQLHLTLACRGAIKAGQPLRPADMQQLLAQLDELSISSHCPHGRPLWRLLTFGEIRQNFRRPR